MKKVAAFIILTFLSFTTIYAADAPPASIHLELGKDTLALAEPVPLTAEITNHLSKDLLVQRDEMFGLGDPYYSFSIYLITPEGQEWRYHGPRMRELVSNAYWLYLVLPSGKSVSQLTILRWTFFVPWKYQTVLEKLPSGTYKLFATYRLPKQEGVEGIVLYSDTVEFVFLPLEEKHLPALVEMNSLSYYLNLRAIREIPPILERIRDSNTPYSEAAYATLLIILSKDYESFKSEKARFDELYPDSPFGPYLLRFQLASARASGQLLEADSIKQVWVKALPTFVGVLREDNKVHVIKVEPGGVVK